MEVEDHNSTSKIVSGSKSKKITSKIRLVSGNNSKSETFDVVVSGFKNKGARKLNSGVTAMEETNYTGTVAKKDTKFPDNPATSSKAKTKKTDKDSNGNAGMKPNVEVDPSAKRSRTAKPEKTTSYMGLSKRVKSASSIISNKKLKHYDGIDLNKGTILQQLDGSEKSGIKMKSECDDSTNKVVKLGNIDHRAISSRDIKSVKFDDSAVSSEQMKCAQFDNDTTNKMRSAKLENSTVLPSVTTKMREIDNFSKKMKPKQLDNNSVVINEMQSGHVDSGAILDKKTKLEQVNTGVIVFNKKLKSQQLEKDGIPSAKGKSEKLENSNKDVRFEQTDNATNKFSKKTKSEKHDISAVCTVKPKLDENRCKTNKGVKVEHSSNASKKSVSSFDDCTNGKSKTEQVDSSCKKSNSEKYHKKKSRLTKSEHDKSTDEKFDNGATRNVETILGLDNNINAETNPKQYNNSSCNKEKMLGKPEVNKRTKPGQVDNDNNETMKAELHDGRKLKSKHHQNKTDKGSQTAFIDDIIIDQEIMLEQSDNVAAHSKKSGSGLHHNNTNKETTVKQFGKSVTVGDKTRQKNRENSANKEIKLKQPENKLVQLNNDEKYNKKPTRSDNNSTKKNKKSKHSHNYTMSENPDIKTAKETKSELLDDNSVNKVREFAQPVDNTAIPNKKTESQSKDSSVISGRKSKSSKVNKDTKSDQRRNKMNEDTNSKQFNESTNKEVKLTVHDKNATANNKITGKQTESEQFSRNGSTKETTSKQLDSKKNKEITSVYNVDKETKSAQPVISNADTRLLQHDNSCATSDTKAKSPRRRSSKKKSNVCNSVITETNDNVVIQNEKLKSYRRASSSAEKCYRKTNKETNSEKFNDGIDKEAISKQSGKSTNFNKETQLDNNKTTKLKQLDSNSVIVSKQMRSSKLDNNATSSKKSVLENVNGYSSKPVIVSKKAKLKEFGNSSTLNKKTSIHLDNITDVGKKTNSEQHSKVGVGIESRKFSNSVSVIKSTKSKEFDNNVCSEGVKQELFDIGEGIKLTKLDNTHKYINSSKHVDNNTASESSSPSDLLDAVSNEKFGKLDNSVLSNKNTKLERADDNTDAKEINLTQLNIDNDLPATGKRKSESLDTSSSTVAGKRKSDFLDNSSVTSKKTKSDDPDTNIVKIEKINTCVSNDTKKTQSSGSNSGIIKKRKRFKHARSIFAKSRIMNRLRGKRNKNVNEDDQPNKAEKLIRSNMKMFKNRMMKLFVHNSIMLTNAGKHSVDDKYCVSKLEKQITDIRNSGFKLANRIRDTAYRFKLEGNPYTEIMHCSEILRKDVIALEDAFKNNILYQLLKTKSEGKPLIVPQKKIRLINTDLEMNYSRNKTNRVMKSSEVKTTTTPEIGTKPLIDVQTESTVNIAINEAELGKELKIESGTEMNTFRKVSNVNKSADENKLHSSTVNKAIIGSEAENNETQLKMELEIESNRECENKLKTEQEVENNWKSEIETKQKKNVGIKIRYNDKNESAVTIETEPETGIAVESITIDVNKDTISMIEFYGIIGVHFVGNIKCGHCYKKEKVMKCLEENGGSIACPFKNCSCKSFTVNEISNRVHDIFTFDMTEIQTNSDIKIVTGSGISIKTCRKAVRTETIRQLVREKYVVNIICGHYYEKAIISKCFEGNESIPCPVNNCFCKSFTVKYLTNEINEINMLWPTKIITESGSEMKTARLGAKVTIGKTNRSQSLMYLTNSKCFHRYKKAHILKYFRGKEFMPCPIKNCYCESFSLNDLIVLCRKSAKFNRLSKEVESRVKLNDDTAVKFETACKICEKLPTQKSADETCVTNIKCGHLYRKEAIMKLFKENESISCPFKGCTCKSFTKNDLKEKLNEVNVCDEIERNLESGVHQINTAASGSQVTCNTNKILADVKMVTCMTNIKCGHCYKEKVIMNCLRGKESISCPLPNCSIKSFGVADLVKTTKRVQTKTKCTSIINPQMPIKSDKPDDIPLKSTFDIGIKPESKMIVETEVAIKDLFQSVKGTKVNKQKLTNMKKKKANKFDVTNPKCGHRHTNKTIRKHMKVKKSVPCSHKHSSSKSFINDKDLGESKSAVGIRSKLQVPITSKSKVAMNENKLNTAIKVQKSKDVIYVTNIKCGHRYYIDAFLGYITRKKDMFCPVGNCSLKSFSIKDLIIKKRGNIINAALNHQIKMALELGVLIETEQGINYKTEIKTEIKTEENICENDESQIKINTKSQIQDTVEQIVEIELNPKLETTTEMEDIQKDPVYGNVDEVRLRTEGALTSNLKKKIDLDNKQKLEMEIGIKAKLESNNALHVEEKEIKCGNGTGTVSSFHKEFESEVEVKHEPRIKTHIISKIHPETKQYMPEETKAMIVALKTESGIAFETISEIRVATSSGINVKPSTERIFKPRAEPTSESESRFELTCKPKVVDMKVNSTVEHESGINTETGISTKVGSELKMEIESDSGIRSEINGEEAAINIEEDTAAMKHHELIAGSKFKISTMKTKLMTTEIRDALYRSIIVNDKCGHHYMKKRIATYMFGKESMPCPVKKCTCKSFTVYDLRSKYGTVKLCGNVQFENEPVVSDNNVSELLIGTEDQPKTILITGDKLWIPTKVQKENYTSRIINIKCGHQYNKKEIMEYFDHRDSIPCPFYNCACMSFTANDLKGEGLSYGSSTCQSNDFAIPSTSGLGSTKITTQAGIRTETKPVKIEIQSRSRNSRVKTENQLKNDDVVVKPLDESLAILGFETQSKLVVEIHSRNKSGCRSRSTEYEIHSENSNPPGAEIIIKTNKKLVTKAELKKVIKNDFARNLICGHHYKKEVIQKYMDGKESVFCPVAGCCKKFTLKDLSEQMNKMNIPGMKEKLNKFKL